MTFHRGATLATAPTLGLADTSESGPTAGNGFFRRWPDDLALFQANDITDVRLSLDWARLQPKPGVIDAGWADQYEQIIAAARAIDLRVWATLYDGSVPRWFDNEGGIGDDDALIKWWPRFVERSAERFGDHIDGWVPFAVIPDGAPDQPWRDTWGILAGERPVVASIHGSDTKRLAWLAGSTDVIGVDVELDLATDSDPSDQQIADLAGRWSESMGRAASQLEVPVAVTLTPSHDDPDISGRLVSGLVTAIRHAQSDGIDVATCFIDPGIAGQDRRAGLFDKDRAPLPALQALVDE